MKEFHAGVDVRIDPNPIGKEQVQRAWQTLQQYRSGKANLEKRVIENQQWYKLRHWQCMQKTPSQVEPVSGWLFNAIAGKHADAMDNFPGIHVLPREASDVEQAKMLSAVLPVILEHSDFEEVYHRVWDNKLIGGTGIYGVFWDKDKLGGLGDIAVSRVDILNLFWQSGINDIQQSRNVFHVALQDNDSLLAAYPELENQLGSFGQDMGKYIYDDAVDTADKSLVVDWYYKKPQGGKTLLHYCKFVGDTVLYASENDPACCDTGWYHHGQYPFIFDPLFRTEGTPCGFGYVDVGKSAQEFIDRGNQALLQNMLVNARPRYFIRADGAVNEAEFADVSKDLVHVDGNLGADSVVPVKTTPLDATFVTMINNKILELKEVTGNRDVVAGGTSGGVTAASAIAAMQEAGSKLSRDANKASYRVFRKVCLLVIELIRQFYDLPRCFRITGPEGESYVNFSNALIAPIHQGVELGMDMGYRMPLFDVEITAQRQNPYSKMSQNELAIQFFNAGFFDPGRAEQALACLEMMDFDRKDIVMKSIRERAALAVIAGAPLNRKRLSGSKNPDRMAQVRAQTNEATAPR